MQSSQNLVPDAVTVSTLMQQSGVTFGTSGARGRVVDMTDRVCYIYTRAFLQYLSVIGALKPGSKVGIAGDLRPSTDQIMNAVARAVIDADCQPVNGGKIPSPAIAYYGIRHKVPTIMVTGSHIPDDRNGIKFNKAEGEILKQDEEGIARQAVSVDETLFNATGNFASNENYLVEVSPEVETIYIQRYLDFFKPDCLSGMKAGVYEHSGVARDILATLLNKLGAEVIHLGRSEQFIPVDTEAIREQDITLAHDWAKTHGLDAIVSTDGDADRPLVGTELGIWLRGDIAGILCGAWLGVEHIVTPVSSNSAVEKSGLFKTVRRTRIGSPYVISGMLASEQEAEGETVAGYEANGGFLLQTPVVKNGKQLDALPTRDAVIVILSLLVAAHESSRPVSMLLESLPPRFTASDRVKNFPTEKSREIINKLVSDDKGYEAIEQAFGDLCGTVASIDTTDGLRISFANKEIVHLRPSGNAPEFRCYNEADTEERVVALNGACMERLGEWI